MENTNKKTQVYNLIILDKSGSMSSIAKAAIAGFNETVGGIRSAQERFKDTQEHFVSLMIFCNCEKTMVYDMVPVEKVKELTSREYRPCCGTPLYDAMGLSINALYKAIKDKEDATAVVTVINVEPDSFRNFFDALYWATVSLTTMGYGDIYPVTTIGRMVTMASSIFGIAIVALPAGIITAGYMDEINSSKENKEE